MPALYRSADVFLHMSLLESFGNVFIEAWASGLPVIGHDTERLRWILGAESQMICDTEDPAALLGMLRAGLALGAVSTGKAQGITHYYRPVIVGPHPALPAHLPLA